MFFRWWGSPLRAAARHGMLPLQCVVVPELVPARAPGGENVRNLLPRVVKLVGMGPTNSQVKVARVRSIHM